MSEVPAPTSGPPPLSPVHPEHGAVRRAGYLVAAGGVLLILELPLMGPLVRLVDMGLVVTGVVRLRRLVAEPLARRRLQAAVALAWAVAALTLGLAGAHVLAPATGTPPSWLGWLAITKMGLGIVGTLALTAGVAHEMEGRGDRPAEDAWWWAAIAVGLVHGPILVAATLTEFAARPAGVQGAAAVALFGAAILPYLLVGRAGRRSDPPVPRGSAPGARQV